MIIIILYYFSYY